jgi:hypothetical protein
MKGLLNLIVCIVLLPIIGLSGCAPIDDSGKTENVTSLEQPVAYPVDKQTVDVETKDFLFVPQSQEDNDVWLIPTPVGGKSVIFGQMLTPGVGGKPYVGVL